MKSRSLDLTQGVIWKSMLLFFVPMLAGSLIQQLYSTVDAIIVGQYVGKAGLAAIDSVASLLRLPVNFFVGLSTGATISISQYFGAQKKEELSDAVHTAAAFAMTGGAVLSVLGVLAAPLCLRLLEIPAEIYTATLGYVRVCFAGLFVVLIYNISAGVLRATGDSRTPFVVLLVAGAINVALDFLFVAVFRWGVVGAAVATVISQAVSAAMTVLALLRSQNNCRLEPRLIRFHLPMLRAMLRIGLPIGLQSALFPVSNMTVQSSVNATGTDNIAAWGLCGKLDHIVWLVIDSFGMTVSTFVAQNFGARQFHRARRGMRMGLVMTLGIIGTLSVLLFFVCEPLSKIFIAPADYDVIPMTGRLMRFWSPFYFLFVFGEMFSSSIRGAGRTFGPMVVTLCGTCVTRILWVLFVVPRFDSLMVIAACYPVSWALTSLMFTAFYFSCRNRILPDFDGERAQAEA